MSHRTIAVATTVAFAALAAASCLPASAQDRTRHRDRPLTITRHTGPRGHGIEYRDSGNEVIAWGGFSANGYGYPRLGAEAARREARNESVRARTDGIYGYGVDGLGGTFSDDLHEGYNNPFYGNAYSSNVGYGGVPTSLAFGPGFASRHITDSEDDDDDDVPGPTPRELGYNQPHPLIDPDE